MTAPSADLRAAYARRESLLREFEKAVNFRNAVAVTIADLLVDERAETRDGNTRYRRAREDVSDAADRYTAAQKRVDELEATEGVSA